MNEREQNNHLHPETVPQDVREIASRLDAMAQRERASAPAGLEDRLLASTSARLHGDAASIMSGSALGSPARRNPWVGLRIAASVAVVGGVGLLASVYMLASRQVTPSSVPGNMAAATGSDAPVTPSNEAPIEPDVIAQEFEEYLAAIESSDAGLASNEDSLDTGTDLFWDDGAVSLEGSF